MHVGDVGHAALSGQADEAAVALAQCYRVDAAATINRALVEAGIAVSELRPERASLEKVFLELTQEEEAA